jgi:hypothetical protein
MFFKHYYFNLNYKFLKYLYKNFKFCNNKHF